jgi:putative flippase GtrA
MSDAEQTPPSAEVVRPASALERIPVGLRQFVKFGVVGGSGTLINLGIFSLVLFLWDRGRAHPPTLHVDVANAIAFCVAVVSNFLLNRFWTFRHRGRIVRHFGRFLLVSLIGYGLNLVAITLLYHVGGVEEHISQLLAILVVVPFNFVGSKWWAFR